MENNAENTSLAPSSTSALLILGKHNLQRHLELPREPPVYSPGTLVCARTRGQIPKARFFSSSYSFSTTPRSSSAEL